MKWKVQREGGAGVADLTDRFDDDPKIFSDNEDFYIWRSDFEDICDWREVLQQANDTVQIIRTLGKLDSLLLDDLEATVVYREHEDGTHDIYSMSEPATVRLRAAPSELRDSETGEIIRTPVDRVQERTKLAFRDERVNELVEVLEKEDSWDNLYQIYEFCEDNLPDGEEPVGKGWISKSDKELFKRTANSWTEIGNKSRHGTRDGVSFDAMEHEEAKRLIERVTNKWIDQRKEETDID